MSRPFFYKCTGILLFILIVAAFIMLRSTSLDTSYKSYLIGRTNHIASSFAAFFVKNEFSHDTIHSYLDETMPQYSDLALVVVFDNDSRPILLDPNLTILNKPELYDPISSDVMAGKFPAAAQIAVTEKYYGSKKFYILSAFSGKGILTLAFPRRLPISFILRFILEIIAVGSISAAFIGICYLTLMKKLKVKTPEKGKKEKKPAKKKEEPAPKKNRDISSFLTETFGALYSELAPDAASVSLINSKTGKPDQMLSFAQGKIVRAKIKGETIDSRIQILRELAKGSHVLRDRSKRVLMPVIRNNVLCAVISVSRTKKFTGKEIAQIKTMMDGIADFF